MHPTEALKLHFGFDRFRDGQEEIIRAILEGENALVIMPTGGGKSLCYQLPAMVKPGLTLVVSPLIALMKDQVDALNARGISASFINSSLTPAEQRSRLRDMKEGACKLVYVAPERFRSESFLAALSGLDLSLFAIDEAHCISQWGHDFRPDYSKLGAAWETLGQPQVVALTATATPTVREDILRVLRIPRARAFVAGFARSNLALRVVQVANDAAKRERVRTLIEKQKTGIVYCATRKKVEAVAEDLQAAGIRFVAYHAGMEESTRTAAQEKFLSGKADVAVATNAFGMGIDRADLRFIAHYEIPGSIEAYYQEVGRAGRDGKPSVCELLFLHPDVRVQEFFLEGSNPGKELIRALWQVLRQRAGRDHTVDLSVADLAALLPSCKNDMAVSSGLVILGRAGYLDRFDIPGKSRRGTLLLKPEVPASGLQIDFRAMEEKERIDRERLRLMVDYAYSTDCRQQFILRALGEQNPGRCGICDRCLSRSKRGLRPPSDEEAVILQKLLSGVARMCRRHSGVWKGKFGKMKVLQVLLGKNIKPIRETGLDRLSTFGILAACGESYVRDLMQEAIENGLLKIEKGEYPLITLTEKGGLIMRGDRNYSLAWPNLPSISADLTREATTNSRSEGGKKKSDPVPVPRADLEIFTLLREERTRLAAERGVPAYVIASDALLRDLAAQRPLSPEEALKIRGVGLRKLEETLPPLLDLIRNYHRTKTKNS